MRKGLGAIAHNPGKQNITLIFHRNFHLFYLIYTEQRRWDDTWTTERMTSPQANSVDKNRTRDVLDREFNPTNKEGVRYVGKLISQKPITLSVINSVLDQAWSRFSATRINEIAPGIVEFEFDRDEDRTTIIDMSSWAINGHVLSIKRKRMEG